MNLKIIKIIDIFLIFGLCFLFHFLYDIFPNFLFSIFFPVNESIWEHMKMLYSSIIFYSIIDYFILKKLNIKFNNFILNVFLSSTLAVIIFLIIYLPIYNIFGENFILNIIVLFIVVVISQFISYYILSLKPFTFLNKISILGIILMYVIFGIFTYYPPTNYLFYDTTNKIYGIKKTIN